MKYISLLALLFSSSIANDFYYEFGKKVEMKPQLGTHSVQNNTPNNEVYTYETTEGKTVKFKNELVVRCKENAYCEDDFSDLAISNYKNIFRNVFLIKVENHNDFFDLAQKLHLKEDIESATPNHVMNMSIR